MNPEEREIDPALRKIMEIPDDQELPDEALCDVMIRALESQQLIIRSSAVHQLVSLGKKNPALAIPKILKALDPAIDYWTVRFGAIEALGEIANKTTVHPLINYLKTDEDPDFRAMVAKQLGEMRDAAREAGPGLIEALKDIGSSEIRENAAHAIGLIQVPNAIEPLITALKGESDHYARREMCWSLGELKNPQALPILVQELKDIDKDTRKNAAEALGKIRINRAIIPLLNTTKDTNVDVQNKAIWALKQFSAEEVITEIESAASNDDLIAIQFYDEYLFNVDNEKIVKRVQKIKEPIISNYREKMSRIKTDLEGCKVFVEEMFQKLQNLSVDDLTKLINHEIPPIESRIGNVSLYEFRKHKWLENELFFELEEINILYRDAGVMTAELRDNAFNLLDKKKINLAKALAASNKDSKVN